MRRLAVALLCGVALVAGCGEDDRVGAYRVDPIVGGLEGPTQLALTDDAWFVAQLNGGESDGTGQVLRLDPDDLGADPAVVLEGLQKPTGVAVFAGELWVMEERRLTRGPLDGSARTVVVDEMTYNGRSQGTLTVDGTRLLFNTSGTTRLPPGPDGSPAEVSGALWAVDASGTITNLAWGFKHAYAHVVDNAGTIWTTEMSDGSYDGEPAADEVVAVANGANHGWPSCVGDNRPVVESGVTDPCAGVPGSQATFSPGATPTGIAVAPWDGERLVVALWVEGRVVQFSRSPSDAPAEIEPVTDQLLRPQHLIADGQRLLVTDHEAGTIVAIEAR